MGAFWVGLVNGLISDVASSASWLLAFLPSSPFVFLESSPIGQYLPAINWIVPVQAIVDSLALWVTAISLYYMLAIVLRWIRAIE